MCKAWENAVKATYVEGKGPFVDPEAYWQWWLDRDAPSPKDTPVLFEDNPEAAEAERKAVAT